VLNPAAEGVAAAPNPAAAAAAAADVALSHGLPMVWATYLSLLVQASCSSSGQEDLLGRLGSKWRHLLLPIADSWTAAGMNSMGVPAAVLAWMRNLPSGP
jgi:hypothetical protein